MILAVNAAEELLQLVLGGPDGVAFSFEEVCAGRMNEVLAVQAAHLLDQAGLTPAGLTGVACVRGPGSFTGVRLALAFCHGLAFAADLPLAGVDYLPLLAASAKASCASGAPGMREGDPSLSVASAKAPCRPDAPDLNEGGLSLSAASSKAPCRPVAPGPQGGGLPQAAEIHALTHSRRGKVYWQGFAADTMASLGPPQDVAATLAAEVLTQRAATRPVRLLGSGLDRNPEAFAALISAATRLHGVDSPRLEPLLSAGLAAVRAVTQASAQADTPLDSQSPRPAGRGLGPCVDALYLRGSDAEENLASIAALRGLSPEEARQRLDQALGRMP